MVQTPRFNWLAWILALTGIALFVVAFARVAIGAGLLVLAALCFVAAIAAGFRSGQHTPEGHL